MKHHQITASMAKDIAFKLGAVLDDEEAGIFADGYNVALLQSKCRDLSQPVDPQISEYEKIMLQAGNSPAIPDGYVMVPVDLTPDMRDAYHNAQEEYESLGGLWSPDHQWKAMLAAAPQEVK